MEPDTIRRLLETSVRYLGLEILACDAVGHEASSAADDGDDDAASARAPLACMLSAGDCVRPQAMA